MEKKKKGEIFHLKEKISKYPPHPFPNVNALSVAMNVKRSVSMGNFHVEHRKDLQTLPFSLPRTVTDHKV